MYFSSTEICPSLNRNSQSRQNKIVKGNMMKCLNNNMLEQINRYGNRHKNRWQTNAIGKKQRVYKIQYQPKLTDELLADSNITQKQSNQQNKNNTEIMQNPKNVNIPNSSRNINSNCSTSNAAVAQSVNKIRKIIKQFLVAIRHENMGINVENYIQTFLLKLIQITNQIDTHADNNTNKANNKYSRQIIIQQQHQQKQQQHLHQYQFKPNKRHQGQYEQLQVLRECPSAQQTSQYNTNNNTGKNPNYCARYEDNERISEQQAGTSSNNTGNSSNTNGNKCREHFNQEINQLFNKVKQTYPIQPTPHATINQHIVIVKDNNNMGSISNCKKDYRKMVDQLLGSNGKNSRGVQKQLNMQQLGNKIRRNSRDKQPNTSFLKYKYKYNPNTKHYYQHQNQYQYKHQHQHQHQQYQQQYYQQEQQEPEQQYRHVQQSQSQVSIQQQAYTLEINDESYHARHQHYQSAHPNQCPGDANQSLQENSISEYYIQQPQPQQYPHLYQYQYQQYQQQQQQEQQEQQDNQHQYQYQHNSNQNQYNISQSKPNMNPHTHSKHRGRSHILIQQPQSQSQSYCVANMNSNAIMSMKKVENGQRYDKQNSVHMNNAPRPKTANKQTTTTVLLNNIAIANPNFNPNTTNTTNTNTNTNANNNKTPKNSNMDINMNMNIKQSQYVYSQVISRRKIF